MDLRINETLQTGAVGNRSYPGGRKCLFIFRIHYSLSVHWFIAYPYNVAIWQGTDRGKKIFFNAREVHPLQAICLNPDGPYVSDRLQICASQQKGGVTRLLTCHIDHDLLTTFT